MKGGYGGRGGLKGGLQRSAQQRVPFTGVESLDCSLSLPAPSSLSHFVFFDSTSKMCQMTGQKPPEVFNGRVCVSVWKVSHKGTGVLRFKVAAVSRTQKVKANNRRGLTEKGALHNFFLL